MLYSVVQHSTLFLLKNSSNSYYNLSKLSASVIAYVQVPTLLHMTARTVNMSSPLNSETLSSNYSFGKKKVEF